MTKTILTSFVSILIIVLIYVNWPYTSLPENSIIDKMVVEKSNHRLYLIKNGVLIKEYSIALGKNPTGHKTRKGDSKTPEGIYVIDYKNPNSLYHLSLHISYPNSTDKKLAEKNDVNPGGMIMIHGIKNGLGFIGRLHRIYDWTNGCIAVTDPEIEEIYRVTPVGIVIEIKP